MASLSNEWSPSQDLLTNAMRELQEAKKLLNDEKSVNAQIAKSKIEMALILIKGVIFSYNPQHKNQLNQKL